MKTVDVKASQSPPEPKSIDLFSLLNNPGSPTVRGEDSRPLLPHAVIIDGGSPQKVVIDADRDSDRPVTP